MKVNFVSEKPFSYRWKLSEIESFSKFNGKKVFSCFACGGGSTMGYKLAGYDVLGACEIDPKIAAVYKANHNPKYLFIEDIRKFRIREDLPEELFDLDILDGSPPCTTFSMSGQREKTWGVKKKFAEGQTEQILDDLYFEFILLAKKLQPKFCITENVTGLIKGNAKQYVNKIITEFYEAGFDCKLFVLNSRNMGVPQSRERVFILAKRKDQKVKWPSLNFSEKDIPFSEIDDGNIKRVMLKNNSITYNLWRGTKSGNYFSKSIAYEGSSFSHYRANFNKVLCCLTNQSRFYHPSTPGLLSKREFCLASSFPNDFNFLKTSFRFICGMSVPPVMMAQIARVCKKTWWPNE